MLASVLIILFSAMLFVYWFRYTCLLILRTKSTEEFAGQIASANRLSFLAIEEQLKSHPEAASLDPLHRSLANDYRVLSYLLEHASGESTHSVEHQMLLLDYKIMQLWYRLTRTLSVSQARKALAEMSSILKYFASTMGQRVASQA
jgi:hypothetical protein